MCGKLCYDNQVKSPSLILPLAGACTKKKFAEKVGLSLFSTNPKMRHYLVLTSLILFTAAQDPIINSDVPDVGQPGK